LQTPFLGAGLYCRISQDRLGGQLGAKRQREDCENYAVQRGWTVADVYVDNDVSASSGRRRPEYERMLADVEAGRIDAVVTWDLYRLHWLGEVEGLRTSLAAAEQKLTQMQRTATNLGMPIVPLRRNAARES
jgi:DNA invertase Pin-like site-specific DNA recombinase